MLAVFVLIVAFLAAFPTTEIGRSLHKTLVEQIARRLNRITPGRATFYVALGLIGLAFFSLFEVEGLRLFSMMAPELILWFGMFDVALFLDAFILALALGASARLQTARSAVRQGVRQVQASLSPRPAARGRASKARRVRVGKADASDPDPAWGAAFA